MSSKPTTDRSSGTCSSAGSGKVAFIDARDSCTVAALVLAEEGHCGQAYRLTGPEAQAIDELAAVMSAAGNVMSAWLKPPRRPERRPCSISASGPRVHLDSWVAQATASGG